MFDNSLPVPGGRLSTVYLRVADVDRAARYFGALLDANFERERIGSHNEQRIIAGSPVVPERIDVVFSDDSAAPPERLCFACADPDAALHRTVALGGTGADVSAARDDQGVPLCFTSSANSTEHTNKAAASGALGVVIVQIPDTGKAREFYHQLFG